ncbi:MAG: PEP-CTERM sorting domain-containing protein, partial [Akkermansiaceae bacterium]|nr:PEP-CTERM sorting domain-containing protein [Akkermansiaceae bacterium]
FSLRPLVLSPSHHAPLKESKCSSFVYCLEPTPKPDQRHIHPLSAFDPTPRTSPLSLFNTTAPTGDWRLFIADVASGEQATLVRWSISMTGQAAVPEPSSALLVVMGAATLLLRRRAS